VVERNPEQREEQNVRHGHGRENRDLANRQRHGQPEVVQLVEPLLDSPDAGVGGQIHLLVSFRLLQALRSSVLLLS